MFDLSVGILQFAGQHLQVGSPLAQRAAFLIAGADLKKKQIPSYICVCIIETS